MVVAIILEVICLIFYTTALFKNIEILRLEMLLIYIVNSGSILMVMISTLLIDNYQVFREILFFSKISYFLIIGHLYLDYMLGAFFVLVELIKLLVDYLRVKRIQSVYFGGIVYSKKSKIFVPTSIRNVRMTRERVEARGAFNSLDKVTIEKE